LKKICYITTVPSTLIDFVVPTVAQMKNWVDWEFTLVANTDPEFEKKLPKGVRYVPIPMQRGISISGIKAMFRMIRLFRKEKFDLVQYSTPNASLYASLAAWVARVPVRLYCQWGIAYVGFTGIKRKIFKAIEKLVCTLSSWVEPDSFGNLNFSHEEGLYPKEKGSVVWNGSASGVNLQKFDISQKIKWRKQIREQYKMGENDFIYGFVGRITGDKGIDELFAACKKLLQKNANVWLMLVGRVDKPETVDQELFAWAQNEKRVIFCGYTDVVEQYLSAMDAYVLPSYREGFGSAAVEAQAMGLPVVVTDISGLNEAMIPNKTGIVVQKADDASLFDAMLQIQEDEKMRAEFGREAYCFATQRFEQTKLAEYILEDRKRLLNCL